LFGWIQIIKQLTYVSLFSSAGVGCYGFQLEGFECIATNELIGRRLAVQKANGKCKFESGYIHGDISTGETKEALFREIKFWRDTQGLTDIDVVIATPPCQGMSVANHKKSENEIQRNSLIVQSITLVSEIMPRAFVFENVPKFLSTICTDTDGVERPIEEAISRTLGHKYSIYSRVVNFKDFGTPSSRTRTLVIGVRNDLADFVSPIELFPNFQQEVLLRAAIGKLPSLSTMGEISPRDIFHAFRPYPKHMERWISGLREGDSAFQNTDQTRIPHQVINGKVIFNQQKNGDKYRRQIWDKVGPCIHTRNDQLASQNTVHPKDNRVFSIRELMLMMAVPSSFKWTGDSESTLNSLQDDDKRAFLKKHEMNIRQSLGEAVPTVIFRSVAQNFKKHFSYTHLTDPQILKLISKSQLNQTKELEAFLRQNSNNLGFSTMSRVVELANSKRQEQEAYFTNKRLVTEIVKRLPNTGASEMSILEPSVGAGNFVPLLVKHFENKEKINLVLNDIDDQAIILLKALVDYLAMPKKVKIRYLTKDFLLQAEEKFFDLVIGNPPFSKSTPPRLLKQYRLDSVNQTASNTAAFFLEKSLSIAKQVAMVMPKTMLSSPEFHQTRELLGSRRINRIIDFGEKGFSGVLVETVALIVEPNARPSYVRVTSITENIERWEKQSYLTDNKFPYWIIYRNEEFDETCKKIKFDTFNVFRDRQITAAMQKKQGDIRVIKSRNIAEDGKSVLDLENYDSYVDRSVAEKLVVYKFLNAKDFYLVPNMTYKPRMIPKPANTLVNGSAAILMLKQGEERLTQEQINFFASDEYRNFYRIARNYQTRSLNLDSNSVFFFGKLKV
jgi:DNA (cytosine-5)-methyltransferase 1